MSLIVLSEILKSFYSEGKTVNEKEEFFSNNYFKQESWHTTDDILSELGLL